MRRHRRTPLARAVPALCLCAGLAAAAPAHAQGTNGLAVDFEDKLLRLVEVLGSVQFLRQLCDAPEGDVWRRRAAAIIEAQSGGEPPDEAVRAQLTAAFNRGYRAFSSYRRCTDSAIVAIDRYVREGEALGRDILVRFGE